MSTLPRRVTEDDLRKMRSEHDAYEALLKAASRHERLMAVVGRVPLELVKPSAYERAQRAIVGDAPSCKGTSCHGARLPCRENCNPIEEEMSVYAPDDERDSRAKAEWDSIILVGLVFLAAVLLAGVVAWVSYQYAEPILAALGRVLN